MIAARHFVGCVAVVVVASIAANAAPMMPHLKRVGTKIFFDTGAVNDSQVEFRSNGFNNYALGVDENFGGVCNRADPSQDTEGGHRHMTHFRIADIIETSAALSGGRQSASLMRSHTVGMSAGHPWSFEPSLGVFNGTNLDSADYAVFVAQQQNVYIVAPLVNQWNYEFEGSHMVFCEWHNISGLSPACTEAFYGNLSSAPAVSFFEFVTQRLSHVNKYTGRRSADEPNIIWQNGNELEITQYPAWTIALGHLVKNLSSGKQLFCSNTEPLSPGEMVADTPVDIFETHYYGVMQNEALAILRFDTNSAIVAAAGRVYGAFEVGWNYNASLSQFLANAATKSNVVGVLAWILWGHCDVYGFEYHGDGFGLHYRPVSAFNSRRLDELTAAAFTLKYGSSDVRCQRPDLWFNTTRAPVLAAFPDPKKSKEQQQPRIAWCGCAGATSYTVERRKFQPSSSSSQQQQPFVPIARLTDNDLPFVDGTAEPGERYQYRVQPVAEQCNARVRGEWSNTLTW
jgi:mannan endo-1,4-beta-mannosidase